MAPRITNKQLSREIEGLGKRVDAVETKMNEFSRELRPIQDGVTALRVGWKVVGGLIFILGAIETAAHLLKH